MKKRKFCKRRNRNKLAHLNRNIESSCDHHKKMNPSSAASSSSARSVTVRLPSAAMDTEDNPENANLCQEVAPIKRIIKPGDVIEITTDDEIINIIGTRGEKVTIISGLENMKSLNTLILRSCLISKMNGIESIITLEKLELYDNQIEVISHLNRLSNLTVLDLSYNSIREMAPVSCCPLLEELYIAQNKLRKIEGLENMTRLRVLDLGANRIRVMEGLTGLANLRSLWLGKNKIEEIADISGLTSLTQLDIQSNRLTQLGTQLLALNSLKVMIYS